MDAYEVRIFQKSERKSRGHRLRLSILNEFREKSQDLKATAVTTVQQRFRSLSEASKFFYELLQHPTGKI